MEKKAVTHSLRWIVPIVSRSNSQTTRAIILTDSMNCLQKVNSGMESPDRHLTIFDIIFKDSCDSTVPAMLASREMASQIDWLIKQTLMVACVWEDVKC